MKNLKNYLKNIKNGINTLDISKLIKIENILFDKIQKNKKIFVCGNGGSASIANHFLCDFNKGIKISSNNKLKPKIFSLSDNMETILAVANDISFNKIFSFQLDNYYAKGDIVILLSCSGSSPNILDTLNYCKKKKIYTITLTGFAKKNIQKKSNINLNLGIKNYGITEDFFQIIMHMLSQSIRLKFIKKNDKVIL
ncbi:SIS domain-containing protein [Candidatus Pelagibacter bacterium nBUS_29]|uniref:SIS domain-containing protein n=1 Tax=Candidatus Pelagibacter bacterium nBUS_29 TaxID=3374190 RepID=UPI003EBBD2FB